MPPLLPLWNGLYRLLARGWAAYLVRGDAHAATYIRGSLAGGDALPGLSDIDVVVVGDRREVATARWQSLRRRFPATDLLLDYPMIFDAEDLRRAASASTLTCSGTAYSGPHSTQDSLRLQERPGLYSVADWHLLSGTDRRPAAAARGSDERRIAAWLELMAWWQWVAPACAEPRGPRTASLCVKLIAEPTRIWLWLAHGERMGRTDALCRGIELIPEEERSLRLALDLQRSLRSSPAPPLAEVLPALVRLSGRIAKLVAQAPDKTEVALAGSPPDGPLPLCDWRGLVRPAKREDWFRPAPGDPGSPSDVAAAADLEGRGPLPSLRAGELMVFAGHRHRTRLRAIASPATDPVSFALADGRDAAAFPELPGWRAGDVARRAVAEHRPVLGRDVTGGDQLAGVLGAARAGLFADGVAAGEPLLAVTLAEAGRRLGDRDPAAAGAAQQAVGELGEFAAGGATPQASTVAALLELTRRLPAFSGARPGSSVHG